MKAFTVSIAVFLVAAQAVANGVCGVNTKEIVKKAIQQTIYVRSCVTVPPPMKKPRDAGGSQEEIPVSLFNPSLEDYSDEELIEAYRSRLSPELSEDDKESMIEDFKKRLQTLRAEMKKDDLKEPAPKKPDLETPDEEERKTAKKSCGIGTGIVLGPNAIITNAHVVMIDNKIAEEVHVRVGRRLYKTTVLGVNTEKDLAALAVDPSIDLTQRGALAASFADSDDLYIGQLAFALGQPSGLEGTLTPVTVAYKNRIISKSTSALSRFVQVNGDIYRGNSGGPTFDCDGNVIGINTAILMPEGHPIGVGLAIPSNVVTRMAPNLFQSRGLTANKTTLGISYRTEEGDEEKDRGVYINAVKEDSLAAAMGFQKDDYVLSIGGVEIDGPTDELSGLLKSVLDEFSPGDELIIKVLRDDQEVSLSGTVGSQMQKN